MTSTAAATSSLVDLKRACALLTGIACGHKHPYADLDGLPPESFSMHWWSRFVTLSWLPNRPACCPRSRRWTKPVIFPKPTYHQKMSYLAVIVV